MPLRIGAATGFVVLAIIAVLWCVKSLEIVSASYESRAGARLGIEAGWIPAWIPESASEIREAHDLDTNKTFVTFKFAPNERFYSDCKAQKKGTYSFFPKAGETHRFPSFVGRALKRVETDGSLRFFLCDDQVGVRNVAVEPDAGVAHVWFSH